MPTEAQSPSGAAAPSIDLPAALVDTKIVFYRDKGSPPRAFMIDPDGSNEIPMSPHGLQPGIWSRDGTRLLAAAVAPSAPGEDGWMRPAMVNADGSGFEIRDAYPGRKLNLVPVGWSSDEARIFVESGYDAADPSDIGLFSVRASDGGDLRSIVRPPPGDAAAGIAGTGCARPDFDHIAPDGSKLLVNRDSLVDGCGTLLLYNADGSGGKRLNPEGTLAVDLEFGDFLERPRLSEAFSPDGTRIAFTEYVTAAD